ncbi:hypothetical protein IEQ34_000239 [Dendrobium chrysotoxum]|uniref:Uncharacterized protein n=1 Tax=Dendrobium chrysotoxum TaxID=161865 RepID=A0AAV7HNJ7_DENCH|nr:hypothetical protein IEQ34_000239 [Dendrobium chrysotoxum]
MSTEGDVRQIDKIDSRRLIIEEKCNRFQSDLKDDIRQPLIPFEIEDYSILVERDRRVEIDF